MTPERWQQVRQVFDVALTVRVAERSAYLEKVCANDSELRREVESLLVSDKQAGTAFLNTPPVNLMVQAADSKPAAGRAGCRIGAYDILEEIGHGGMGEVYRAVRADGQYEKEVAIKLVRGEFDSEYILERFRNERQILASLDHPNIARLLDGGTTEDGIPYLVMELVDGIPIDQYCDAHRLSISKRLELFRAACAAVQYAHQRLVTHRDIKPSNVLVTDEGSPKLLDFGIAKIFDPAGRVETTLVRPMTLEYASPEQIRGETITTATDVYSLGVVLYLLLTGRLPYPGGSRATHELARTICETEPGRPSTAILKSIEINRDGQVKQLTPDLVAGSRDGSPAKLRRRLAGDLDNIAMKALRKEAQRRYVSVEQLAEDVRRHLEGLPITARKDSASYRAGKFVRRHQLGVVATALIVVMLIGGVVGIAREAGIAAANSRRAEARFNDVRKLANSLMFEIHDSIATLPGSTPARELMVQKSLEYLDSLAHEAGGDVALQRELATAYEKVGQVKGNAFGPNLGDPAGALDSFRKALAIRRTIVAANSGDPIDQIGLAGTYRRIGQVQWLSLDATEEGLESLQKAAAIAEAVAKKVPGDLDALKELAADRKYLGDIQEGNGVRGSAGNLQAALENHRTALTLLQKIVSATPSDLTTKIEVAMANAAIGDDLVKAGDRDQALNQYLVAREFLEPLAQNANDALLLRSLAICYTRTADALLMNGKPTEALKYYRKESRLFQSLAAADPKDMDARSYLITTEGDIGHALVQAGRIREGQVRLLRALAEQTALVKSANDSHSRSLLASTEILVGEAFEHAGDFRAAQQNYSRALDVYSSILAADPQDMEDAVNVVATRDHLGKVYVKLAYLKKAEEEYRKALRAAESLTAAKPDDMQVLYALADTYAGLGDLSTIALGHEKNAGKKSESRSDARAWYEKSLHSWQMIPNPSHISPNQFEVGDPRDVARRLEEIITERAQH